MPIIKSDALNEDYEDKPVAEGKYPLRVIKAEKKRNKKDTNDMIVATIKVEGPDAEGAALINEYLVIPNEGDEHFRMQMRNLTRFLTLFGWDKGADFDPDEDAHRLEGLTADCTLTQEEGDDGVVRNRLKMPKVG